MTAIPDPQPASRSGPLSRGAAGPRPRASRGSKPAPPGTRLSTDGSWWWNGAEWVPAVTPDGLWSWQGAEWRFALAGVTNSAEVARELERLADERYAQAGELLAARPQEWPVPPAMAAEVELANRAINRIGAIDRQLEVLEPQTGGQGLSAVFGRLAGVDDERERLATERAQLQSKLGADLPAIGRGAPIPSYRAADEFLVPAARLSSLAQEVASATAAVMVARSEQEDRVAAAQRELDAAGAARSRAVQAAEGGLRSAENEHQEAVAAAWRELGDIRSPEPGEEVGAFGPLRLTRHLLLAPGGRALVSEVATAAGPVRELLGGEPELVDRIFLAAAPGAAELHQAELDEPDLPYLLVCGGGATMAVACRDGEEGARAFAGLVAQAAQALKAASGDRRRRLAKARARAEAVAADRSRIEAAAAELERVENDPALVSAMDAAQARLEAERADRSGVEKAIAALDALIASIGTAPAPLRVA